MVRHITLSGGETALVDDEDYEAFGALKWSSHKIQLPSGRRYVYAQRKNGRRTIGLHRLILAAPRGLVVDHINGDTLDNRRDNLRLVTHKVNMRNRHGANANSVTGVRNVRLDSRNGRFIVSLQPRSGYLHIGTYASLEEATKAAARVREEVYGTP